MLRVFSQKDVDNSRRPSMQTCLVHIFMHSPDEHEHVHAYICSVESDYYLDMPIQVLIIHYR